MYFCNIFQNKRPKDMPLISFIITCYNLLPEQVTECIYSITRLSLREEEREIIVVDDGSKECLLKDLMEIADNIIYIRQANAGKNAARNIGIKMSEAKYIQFINGEDKLISEAYEHCIDIIRYNNPDIVIFNHGNNENGQNDYMGEEPTEGSEFMKRNSLQIAPWGYVFSKRILIGLRFPTDIYTGDKEFTTLLFIKAEKVYSTSAVAYFDRKKKREKIDRSNKKLIIQHLNDFETILIRLNNLSTAMSLSNKIAMQRRLAQMTMEYIIKTIKWTRSAKQLNMRIKNLEEQGLFPLPDRYYSKKYIIFNKLSRNTIARKLIMKVLG